jgi:hypothetical protein
MSIQENISSYTKQATQLLDEVQKVSDPMVQQALAKRIDELRTQVMDLGEDQAILKHQVARLVILSRRVVEGPALPVPHEVDTVLGRINQYDVGKGPNSACTSCAQCFLSRVLPKGTACSMQSSEIDDIVQDGYYNFALLLRNKLKEAQTVGMPEDVVVAQAMDTSECSDIYGLQILNAGGDKEKRVLVKGEDHTTKGFFRQLLTEFRGSIGRREALGGVIHSQGKTFALALFRNTHGFEWALFDSHGYPDGQAPAYVKHTDSQEEMVTCLSELIEYKACNDPKLADLPAPVKAPIEAEENGFILYVVEHHDHVLLAEPCVIFEPKIDGELSVNAGSVTNIERRLALFLLIIAALGVTYRFYLNRRISQEVVVLPKAIEVI